MQVILKENIKGIGKKYEVKDVSDGYANNFLIPKKLAEYASPEAVKKAKILEASLLAEIEIKEKLTQSQIEMLKGVKVILSKKANEKGHLFEKIHLTEIAEVLKEQAKIDIGVEFLNTLKPIKEIGDHLVQVEIGKNRGEFGLVVEKLR